MEAERSTLHHTPSTSVEQPMPIPQGVSAPFAKTHNDEMAVPERLSNPISAGKSPSNAAHFLKPLQRLRTFPLFLLFLFLATGVEDVVGEAMSGFSAS